MSDSAGLGLRARRAPLVALIAVGLVDALLVLAAGVVWVLGTAFSAADHPESALGLGLVFGGTIALMVILVANLRRDRAWAWVVQLILLCLVTAVALPLSVVLVPLLVAWCGPAVHDWFDPPMRRPFG